MDEDEIEEIVGGIDSNDPRYGLIEYSSPGYYVQPYQCTILEDFASKPKNIILQSYSEGKTYKLKFRTGSSDVDIGDSASTTRIRFNANYGNGPEGVDELNASNIVFTANTTYLIALHLGMIQVIAKI